jgi:hypothetical protein
MTYYAIFLCTALIGHPQMKGCVPSGAAIYRTLEECKAEAAKMPIGPDEPPHAAYVCLPQT